MKTFLHILIFVSLCFCLTGYIFANEVEFMLSSQNTAIISHSVQGKNDKNYRVLFKIPISDILLSNLQSSQISFAYLEFNSYVPALMEDSKLTLLFCPITTNWEKKNVNWKFPWNHHGGDIDSLNSYIYSVVAGDTNTIRLDITKWAKFWLEHPDKNYGIIVRVLESEDCSFIHRNEDNQDLFAKINRNELIIKGKINIWKK
jgi:hypothetical protein